MSTAAWEPGVPLHPDPRGLPAGGRQIVRDLFQVLDDDENAVRVAMSFASAKCRRCQVTWANRAHPCFVCGGRSW